MAKRTKSALKANRQNIKRRDANRQMRSRLRTALKAIRASLDDNDMGVYTDLKLTGVSFENAKRMAQRYLEAIHRR